MEGSYVDKYGFLGEWYDENANLTRKYYVFYYPTDDTVEMYDSDRRKTFVRRVKVDGVTLDSFYIGCTLHILGRLIKIVDFSCENTRRKLSTDVEVIFAMIKPVTLSLAGKILTYLHNHGLRPTRMKKCRLTLQDVIFIYRRMVADVSYPFHLEHLSGQLVIGFELLGKNIRETAKRVIGDVDPAKAEPGTLRALYGVDRVRNCIFISPSLEVAVEDLAYFFPPLSKRSLRLRLTATLSNCTLCIVKPHAIREGKLGAVLEAIDEGGFDVTALNMLIVEMVNTREFYEVYKGIGPEYKGMMEELSSGPCVAMEIVSKDKSLNSAVEFRKLVGPVDPEIARLLRPHTIRAKLGRTKVQNAVHCSDLPEDGLLEVEYFFKILDF